MLKGLWFALALFAAGGVAAQGYPNKPVRIIVTFTVGGAADLTARLLGDRLSDLWKQQVLVENRIGAGGNQSDLDHLQNLLKYSRRWKSTLSFASS